MLLDDKFNINRKEPSNPALTYKLTPLTDISGVVFCIQLVTLLPMAISGLASQYLYFHGIVKHPVLFVMFLST